MGKQKTTISDVLFAYTTMINLAHERKIKIHKFSTPLNTSWSLYEDHQRNFFIRIWQEIDNRDIFDPKKKYTLDFSDSFFARRDYEHVIHLFSSSEKLDGYIALSTYNFKTIRKVLNEMMNIVHESLVEYDQ